MRGAPFLANLTREQATSMNARMRKVPEERTPAQVHGAVQAVHSCPWPECMVLRCFHHSLIGQLGPNNLTAQASRSGVIRAYTRQTQDIEGFVASAPSKTKLRVGMQRNFAQVAAMIKAHPCLKRDFQVFCPTMVFLNIDLDRCKQNASGYVSLSDTEMRALAHVTITLSTRPLKCISRT